MVRRYRAILSAVTIALLLTAFAGAEAASASAHGKAAATPDQSTHKRAGRHRHRKTHRRSPKRSARRGLQVGRVANAIATTPPAPGPLAGGLFDGSRISEFWVDHSAPGAITEVPDPVGSGETVMDMTVANNDVFPITPTENPRAELLSPGTIRAGQQVWLATKFMVPTDYPAVPAGGWVSLVSFYGAPFAGPSPWRLELAGDNLQWQRNATYGYDVPFQEPLQRGKWIEVLVHEYFASEGSVEMWIDGNPIDFFSSGGYNPSENAATTQLDMATMDASNDAGPNSAKIMQYREAGMFESGSIFFGPLKVGASRAAVES